MQVSAFLNFLQSSWLATLLDGSRYIAMLVQIFHILGFTFLLALVLAFNIRVLRLSLRELPVNAMARALQRPFLLTLAVAVIAGILLFLPRATTYAANEPFLWKMGLLLAAGSIQVLLLRHAASTMQIATTALPQSAVSAYRPALTQAYPTLAYSTAWASAAGTIDAARTEVSTESAARSEASLLFRAASLLALLLWLATGVAGRAIGFV